MRLFKHKGSVLKPQQGGISHAEKIKNIKQAIATDFKHFYQRSILWVFKMKIS